MADFMGLMKQAAQLQSKMQALQAELDTIEVEGTAGGGMVRCGSPPRAISRASRSTTR